MIEIPMTIAEVKTGLPIPYVLTRAGVEWEDGFDGKVHAVCPFHNDHEPSLDVFAPNRWNCPPCGAGGDVLDLLRRFSPSMTFGQAMEWAERLIREMKAEGWSGYGVGLERPPFNVEAGSALVARAYQEADLNLMELFRSETTGGVERIPPWPFVDWLHDEFGVGTDGNRLVIPYWASDGTLRTYRIREGHGKPRSAPGTYAPTFYGEWRDQGRPLVVLCEGESDTWAATSAVEDVADVLGVPGVGRSPWGRDRLLGRQVVIAFDGDVAGRAGAVRWRSYLPQDQVVQVIELPDGRDLASYPSTELRGRLLG